MKLPDRINLIIIRNADGSVEQTFVPSMWGVNKMRDKTNQLELKKASPEQIAKMNK